MRGQFLFILAGFVNKMPSLLPDDEQFIVHCSFPPRQAS